MKLSNGKCSKGQMEEENCLNGIFTKLNNVSPRQGTPRKPLENSRIRIEI